MLQRNQRRYHVKTPSTANLVEEEIVDALGNDGNASMPEQVKRPNAWRKMMMMMKLL
jgi:hypothetical protein